MGEIISLYRDENYFIDQIDRIVPENLDYDLYEGVVKGSNQIILTLSGNIHRINALSSNKELIEILNAYVMAHKDTINGYLIGANR